MSRLYLGKMITSKQNPLVKTIKSLKDKKNRDELGVYVIEGVKMVREALQCGVQIQKIIATEKGCELLGAVDGVCLELVSDQVFESITDEVTPQGILAVAIKPDLKLRAPQGSCLLLDGVSDPGNVGAIIRTAAAAGYKDLYLCACADAYSQKSVRASMSGIYKVNVFVSEREKAVSVIDLPFVIADMSGKSVFSEGINKDFCLVIGSEAHGVSSQMRERADYTISIPMQNGMESLNAAVSAGIIMYALKNK